MTKRLLIFSFIVSLTLMTPQVVQASDAIMPAVEQSIDEDIVIKVSGQTVTISGAQGLTLEVISLTGRCVSSIKIQDPVQRIDLNVPKGCYILKIGKVARKVTVR